MPVPPAGSEALALYEDALEPYTAEDAANDHALGTLLTGLLTPIEEIAAIVRDDPETGHVGWGKLVDAEEAPLMALPWLAQLAGVRDIAGMTEADRRARIKELAYQKRGTVAAMEAAAQAHLTGTKQVTITERVGGNPWQIAAETLIAETPDEALVEAAILSQKPAGIVLDYTVV